MCFKPNSGLVPGKEALSQLSHQLRARLNRAHWARQKPWWGYYSNLLEKSAVGSQQRQLNAKAEPRSSHKHTKQGSVSMSIINLVLLVWYITHPLLKERKKSHGAGTWHTGLPPAPVFVQTSALLCLLHLTEERAESREKKYIAKRSQSVALFPTKDSWLDFWNPFWSESPCFY